MTILVFTSDLCMREDVTDLLALFWFSQRHKATEGDSFSTVSP